MEKWHAPSGNGRRCLRTRAACHVEWTCHCHWRRYQALRRAEDACGKRDPGARGGERTLKTAAQSGRAFLRGGTSPPLMMSPRDAQRRPTGRPLPGQ